MKHIYYATTNGAKFNDVKDFLTATNSEYNIEQLVIDIPEIQSDNHDDILRKKVEFVRNSTNRPFIVDDASFSTERFPAFPGAYAKFVNESLGIEGWKRLFNEGDKISAVARIALYNFGDVQYFSGQIEGTLSFNDIQDETPFSLNNHILIKDGRLLSDALRNPLFLNHRRKALKNLVSFLSRTDIESNEKKLEIGTRWDNRAPEWKSLIEDEDSYVNYEHNYKRVNAMIEKYAPLASGAALEIGCGTGEAGRILKASNPKLELLSTDISDGMIIEAKEQTSKAGLDINYKQLDVTGSGLGEDKFGIVISRGVVVSHLPKSNIYDFLESAAFHTDFGGYLLFDFIQNTSVGEIVKPIDSKNEFKIGQMDEIMTHFGMKRIEDAGNDAMRVRVVCYQRTENKGGHNGTH